MSKCCPACPASIAHISQVPFVYCPLVCSIKSSPGTAKQVAGARCRTWRPAETFILSLGVDQWRSSVRHEVQAAALSEKSRFSSDLMDAWPRPGACDFVTRHALRTSTYAISARGAVCGDGGLYFLCRDTRLATLPARKWQPGSQFAVARCKGDQTSGCTAEELATP